MMFAMNVTPLRLACVLLFLGTSASSRGADYRSIPTPPTPGDAMLDAYFQTETRRLTVRSLGGIETREDWEKQRDAMRRQLFEMLGLQPLPAKSPLKATITGTVAADGIVVEKLAFQSRPGLYVTGDLYRPVSQDGPLPTILYVCGHGGVKKDGISYGNKTHYQHHGAWFARNGYVCLIIDTLQLGEIEGIHHGTFKEGRWWWPSRGYTPAGVEAWNCIRALDYLETRPEVDKTRFGVTGRSGGGAYSWWIAALDERIQCAVPVAGITSLKNHVVDGCVEGHCDCMFQVNTYRWDYPMVAALVAPRPLLIGNTDKDNIFPLDGVVDVYNKTRHIYELLGAGDKIGLALYEGPHKDTQPLRVDAFHWFNRFLKGKSIDDELADTTAPKPFPVEDLKVFATLPDDERNTHIDKYFTRLPKIEPAESAADWRASRDQWMRSLQSRSFRGWPGAEPKAELTQTGTESRDGVRLTAYTLNSQEPWNLPVYLVHREGLKPEDLDLVVLNVVDDAEWPGFLSRLGAAFPNAMASQAISLPSLDAEGFAVEKQMHESQKWGMAYLCPRGIGPTAWTTDAKERTQILRRFLLLGQTLEGMQVWDIRRGIQGLRSLPGMDKPALWLQSTGVMATNTLYASLWEPAVTRLDLHGPPPSHEEGPSYLNVMRFLDVPQAAAMVADRSKVRIYDAKPESWSYLTNLGKILGWDDQRVQIRKPVSE